MSFRILGALSATHRMAQRESTPRGNERTEEIGTLALSPTMSPTLSAMNAGLTLVVIFQNVLVHSRKAACV